MTLHLTSHDDRKGVPPSIIGGGRLGGRSNVHPFERKKYRWGAPLDVRIEIANLQSAEKTVGKLSKKKGYASYPHVSCQWIPNVSNLEVKSGLNDIEFGELLRLDSIGTRPNPQRSLLVSQHHP
jgi:hypothetical protein